VLLAATPADPEAFGTFYRRHVRAVLARAPAHAIIAVCDGTIPTGGTNALRVGGFGF
jgi:hypothetical protein